MRWRWHFEELEPRRLFTTVFSEDFEGIWPGRDWDRDSNQSAYQWDETDFAHHAGARSAFCAELNRDPNSDSYPDSLETQFWRSSDLRAFSGAMLTFWTLCDTQPDADFLSVTVNGAEVWRESGTHAWQEHSLDLGAYAGQDAVEVRFIFLSDSAVTRQGVWIDDIALTAQPLLPDLRVTDILMDGSTVPPSVLPGQNVRLDFDTVNEGQADAPRNVRLEWYWGTTENSTANLIDFGLLGSAMAPGEAQREVDRRWTIPDLAPGTYWLTARIDADDQVEESDEGDNVLSEAFVVTEPARPDLRVTDTLMNGASALPSVQPGQDVRLDFDTINEGQADGPRNVRLEWYWGTTRNSTANLIAFGFLASALAPGQTERETDLSWIIPSLAPGTYWLTARVDPDNQVVESDESDNLWSESFVVPEPPRPDLRVTDILVNGATALPSVRPGQDVRLDFDSINEGQAGAPAGVRLEWYWGSTQNSTANLIDFGLLVSALAPGQTERATDLSWIIPSLAPGTYWLTARIDPDNVVAESDEGDNLWSESFVVPEPARPDLRVTDTLMNGASALPSVQPGQDVRLDFDTINEGQAGAPAGVRLEWYWGTSRDSTANLIDFGLLASALSPGQTERATDLSWIIPVLAPGTYWLTARIDPNNQVAESDEGDNFWSESFVVEQPPDDHANAGDFVNASPIGLDGRTGDGAATGIIDYAGDTDLFTVLTLDLQPTVTGVRPVYIQVVTPAGGLVDGSVRVFNQSFVQIAANVDGMPGATAVVSFDYGENARFYILVEAVGAGTGSYAVRVDTEPPMHFLYYPEGYSATTIDEFIPLINPNSFDVHYTIIARYEVGTRDQVLVAGATIAAHSRGGITITTRADPSRSMTRPDTPYALEIQSDGQLGATFSHYDFGVTTGENFTNTISTTWAFSEAHRDGIGDPAAPGNLFNDFLVFYNPSDADTVVTVRMIYDDGSITTFDYSLGALRRGGINFDTNSNVTKSGRFGVQLTSTRPIVAALSSYDILNGRGYGLLGNAEGGSIAGAVPDVSTGGGVESSLSILNAGGTSVSVTITFSYTSGGAPDSARTVNIPGNSRATFTLSELGLVDGGRAGVRYSATVPVTLAVVRYQHGDGDAAAAAIGAATTAIFGDAFVNPAFAGTTYIENLGLYNPASSPVDIGIRFLFTDGTLSPATVVTVAPRGFAWVSVDQDPSILSRTGPTAFSIRLDGATPFVAAFTHYDLLLNGGWGTLGAPVGLDTPLSRLG